MEELATESLQQQVEQLDKRRTALLEQRVRIDGELLVICEAGRAFAVLLRHKGGTTDKFQESRRLIKAPPEPIENLDRLIHLVGGSCVGMTIADACEEILQTAERPMRSVDLAYVLYRAGIPSRSSQPGTVVTTVLVRHPDRFVRTRPGLWALVESGGDDAAPGTQDVED